MDAAHLLQKSGVDVLTFPDSPLGTYQSRFHSHGGEGGKRDRYVCHAPYLLSDKNAIAMRSQLLGAYINGIQNFLCDHGRPHSSMVRTTVKSVFNFDSVGLMQILADMNEEQFTQAPANYGGAINQGRRNLEVEIGRVKKKWRREPPFSDTAHFHTQEKCRQSAPDQGGDRSKDSLRDHAFVSLKNATFMKNEMAGIDRRTKYWQDTERT